VLPFSFLHGAFLQISFRSLWMSEFCHLQRLAVDSFVQLSRSMKNLTLSFCRFLGVLLFLGILFQGASSLAYFEAVINSRNETTGQPLTAFNPKQRTHVIVLGNGDEFALAAIASARLKALKWMEIAPRDQIYIISADHKSGGRYLTENGYQVTDSKGEQLWAGALIKRLAYILKIASLEVYSHSNPPYGVMLDLGVQKDTRVYLSPFQTLHEELYLTIKNNFTSDAFAVLFGCNSAWRVAPALSLLWGIPVAGALQATEFQIMGRDGNYYVGTKGNVRQYGKQLKNKNGFLNPVDCGVGCYRLRPENKNYSAYWGHFKVGLPFFKFFCVNPKDWPQIQQSWSQNYKKVTNEEWADDAMNIRLVGDPKKENISPERCLKSMAQFMFSEPSTLALSAKSTDFEFRRVVQEFLCPHTGDRNRTDRCMLELNGEEMSDAQENHSNFMKSGSNLVQCDLKSCAARVVCKKAVIEKDGVAINAIPEGGCQAVNLSPKLVTTLVQEYRNYIAGFSLLMKESSVIPVKNY